MEGQYQERRQAQSINHLPEARSNRILGSISQPIRGQIESLSGSIPTLYSDTDFGFEFWTCMGYIFPLRMGAFSGQDGSTFPPRPGSLFPQAWFTFHPLPGLNFSQFVTLTCFSLRDKMELIFRSQKLLQCLSVHRLL